MRVSNQKSFKKCLYFFKTKILVYVIKKCKTFSIFHVPTWDTQKKNQKSFLAT